MSVVLRAVPVPPEVHTLGQWAEVIRADLTGAVEGLIAAGLHLVEAKAEHPGTFVAWLESGAVGIGRSHAYRLMSVADSVSLIEGNRRSHLPSDSNSLAELARLAPAQLAAAVDAGEVTPDMGRRDAQALVRTYLLDGRSQRDMAALPGLPDEIFRVIVADPPWQYGNSATRNRTRYETMTIEDLCAIDVAGRSAEDAHLYLWVTNNFLREGFDILEAWGFVYKTCLTWVKPQIGMGNYFRSSTEHVLFGTRGSLGTNSRSLRNVFQADRTRHSVKPGCFYDLVEEASPGPYLEMFSRQTRTGWTSWGNEE